MNEDNYEDVEHNEDSNFENDGDDSHFDDDVDDANFDNNKDNYE